MDNLIYLYGIIPESEAADHSLDKMKDFEETGFLQMLPVDDVIAITCLLDASKYTEESIQDKIDNDMEWLQEKAFHHHETVMNLSKLFTVIPLKFCTLYKNEDSLRTSILENEEKMLRTLESIAGKEEWNLKVYCDDQLLKEQFSENNPAAEAKRAEISELSKGRQFFEKKKLDKWMETEIEAEKDTVSEAIHRELCDLSTCGHVKKTWSKDVTGKKDPMTWNSVYLMEVEKVEQFLERIQQYQKDMKAAGWQFEASGPWPAYHFSSLS